MAQSLVPYVPVLTPLLVVAVQIVVLAVSAKLVAVAPQFHIALMSYGLAFDVWAWNSLRLGHLIARGGVWHIGKRLVLFPNQPRAVAVDPFELWLVPLALLLHFFLLLLAALPVGRSFGWLLLFFFAGLAPCLVLVMRRPNPALALAAIEAEA